MGSEVVGQPVHHCPAAGVGGQVGGEDLRGDAVLGREPRGQRLEPLGVAGDEDEVRSLGGQLLGEGQADPGGGAGDACSHGPSVPRAGQGIESGQPLAMAVTAAIGSPSTVDQPRRRAAAAGAPSASGLVTWTTGASGQSVPARLGSGRGPSTST